MALASLILSTLSLIAVVIIGVRSIRLGERSTQAAEHSVAEAARSTEATARAAAAAEQSLMTSERVADATLKSTQAAERMAAMVKDDIVLRRIEAVLDTLVEMKDLFHRQYAETGPEFAETMQSPTVLARAALQRKLEVRLVAVAELFDATTTTATLATTSTWDAWRLESAIKEAKERATTVARRL